jgi:hypothetical protein
MKRQAKTIAEAGTHTGAIAPHSVGPGPRGRGQAIRVRAGVRAGLSGLSTGHRVGGIGG